MPDPRRFLASIGVFLAVLSLGAGPRAFAQQAAAYTVIDAAGGHVLIASNANRRLTIGSLTNIATAMVVLDWLDLRRHDINEPVTIGPEASIFPQNPIGFQTGDQASIRDLLYAALMQSDDIAAYALAMHVGRDLPTTAANETPMQAFVAQMNALARRLNMRNTLFVDSNGLQLNERRPPFSTAADLALLTRYAMNRSQFRFYVSQRARQITIDRLDTNPLEYTLANTNELLDVDAIDGVKTGASRGAGPCVIISAPRPPESVQQGNSYIITPRRIIVVVLGSPNRFDTANALLQSGWQAYEQWVAGGRRG